MSETTQDPTVHPRFNVENFDIVLVSSDEVKFKLNKKEIPARSSVFGDMFETGTAEDGAVEEVGLAETAEVFAFVLAYGTDLGNIVTLETPHLWGIVKAFDKYDFATGVHGVALAFKSRVEAGMVPRARLVDHYVFATNFYPADRDLASRRILNARLSSDALIDAFDSLRIDHGLSDGGSLLRLLRNREALVARARSGPLMAQIGAALHGQHRGLSVASVGYALDAWAGAAVCTTAANLEAYREQRRPTANKRRHHLAAYDLLPWRALRQVYEALPEDLD